MLTLSACGSREQTEDAGAPSAAAAGNPTVTIGQLSEVANLNPALQPRTPDSNAHTLIYSYLVIPTEDLSYVGDLATGWTVSEDGLRYVFTIRDDALWHDGTPVTAEDVVFTFTSIVHPDYNGGADGRMVSVTGAQDYREGKADKVAGLYAQDEHTVVFELNTPNAAFLSNMYYTILPKHILGDVSPGEWDKNAFNTNPVGSGKYKFVRWESGQFMEFKRNDEYYGAKPSIENVILRFGDDTTLAAALINGEIDILYNMSVSELDTIDVVSGVSAYLYQSMSMYYIGLNQLNEHLGDLRVRQALSHGLDKDVIISTVYGDTAHPTDDLFPENHWSHSETVTVYEYDPAKAKSLLEEAGYTMGAGGYYEKNGSPLSLTYDLVDSTDGKQVAQMVQQYWKEIGVQMEIITQDFSTLAFTKLFPSDENGDPRFVTADDFACYTLGFGVEADPDEYRDYFVTPSGPGSWNFITYSNAEVDRLFTEQLLISDQAQREALYHNIADLMSLDIPWIPLYSKSQVAGLSDRVQGFVADYRGINFQIEKWTLS
jgi:peptide/nickel transport system substrate-binding protein